MKYKLGKGSKKTSEERLRRGANNLGIKGSQMYHIFKGEEIRVSSLGLLSISGQLPTILKSWELSGDTTI